MHDEATATGISILLVLIIPQAWFSRLVERLSAEGGEPPETINADVGTIGLEEELAILMETGIQTQPDVVVLDMYLNDVLPSPGVRIVEVPPLFGRSWFITGTSSSTSPSSP